MNKIKQILFSLAFWKGSVFNCFTQSHNCDSTNSLSISLHTITKSLKERSSFGDNSFQLNPSNLLVENHQLERVVSVSSENDLFLISKPSTYSKLLEGFINHNGVDSPKVKQIISPEVTLADRVSNIHVITGDSNFYVVGRPLLQNKESMNRLLDSVNTLDTSLSGVEDILTNNQDALRLAIEIISS